MSAVLVVLLAVLAAVLAPGAAARDLTTPATTSAAPALCAPDAEAAPSTSPSAGDELPDGVTSAAAPRTVESAALVTQHPGSPGSVGPRAPLTVPD